MNTRKIFLSTITLAAFSVSTLSFPMHNVRKFVKIALGFCATAYLADKVYNKYDKFIKTNPEQLRLLDNEKLSHIIVTFGNDHGVWLKGYGKIYFCRVSRNKKIVFLECQGNSSYSRVGVLINSDSDRVKEVYKDTIGDRPSLSDVVFSDDNSLLTVITKDDQALFAGSKLDVFCTKDGSKMKLKPVSFFGNDKIAKKLELCRYFGLNLRLKPSNAVFGNVSRVKVSKDGKSLACGWIFKNRFKLEKSESKEKVGSEI